MVKPFSMNELVRTRAGGGAPGVCAAPEPARGEQIEIEELRIDPREGAGLRRRGRAANLTPDPSSSCSTSSHFDRGPAS